MEFIDVISFFSFFQWFACVKQLFCTLRICVRVCVCVYLSWLFLFLFDCSSVYAIGYSRQSQPLAVFLTIATSSQDTDHDYVLFDLVLIIPVPV